MRAAAATAAASRPRAMLFPRGNATKKRVKK
jgi:hypothetical protein